MKSKSQLNWRRVPREALAQHLRETDIINSEAVGGASIYHCHGKDSESMVIALPGESSLIIDLKCGLPPPLDRRRTGKQP